MTLDEQLNNGHADRETANLAAEALRSVFSDLTKPDDVIQQLNQLQSEIMRLHTLANEKFTRLENEKKEFEDDKRKISELQKTIDELQSKRRSYFFLSRISESAQKAVLQQPKLLDTFVDTRECNAFVLSVDVRQSTALMLKARTPGAFASFINGLCSDLEDIITQNHGVYDKFTGDGILAFFPDFFSGTDAGYFACISAIECHKAFKERYQKSRTSFTSVLNNVGLGIGVDYGIVHLLQRTDSLTVVGTPVVYACRLGGAPAGKTYLNQPAYEQVQQQSSKTFFITEESLEIKHEGPMLAYSIELSGETHNPKPAAWQTI